jgi:hypothetical protein
VAAAATSAPEIRVGPLDIPLETIELIDLSSANFDAWKSQVAAVEQERYGTVAHYPPDVLRAGRRPLLQYPIETLETTMSGASAIGVALRDRVSVRVIGYALGSMLEEHDEEGVQSDPHFGESNTFYLQALAVLPTVQNNVALETRLLESLRTRATDAGFAFFSTLIEEQIQNTGPAWFRDASVLERVDNYLGSGTGFAYFQVPLKPAGDQGADRGDGNSPQSGT